MTSAVTDFKVINRILRRQCQKTEFDEKNPPPPAWYSLPSCCQKNGSAPYAAPQSDPA